MALDTYEGLKQAVIDHLERSDLTDHVDDFIDLAEARHKRDIRIREMLSRSTLAISADDQYIDLPADFLDLKYLRIQAPSSNRGFLPDFRQISIDEMTQCSATVARCPRFFAVHAQIELDAPADQAYTGQIFYYVTPTALSDANASNVVLAKAPDVYLYAALSASAPFLMHDERVPLWESLYTNAAAKLNTSDQENSRGGLLIARVRGAV